MKDTNYCRPGWGRCKHHSVEKCGDGEEWDCCKLETSHTKQWERCPYPSRIENLEKEVESQ